MLPASDSPSRTDHTERQMERVTDRLHSVFTHSLKCFHRFIIVNSLNPGWAIPPISSLTHQRRSQAGIANTNTIPKLGRKAEFIQKFIYKWVNPRHPTLVSCCLLLKKNCFFLLSIIGLFTCLKHTQSSLHVTKSGGKKRSSHKLGIV